MGLATTIQKRGDTVVKAAVMPGPLEPIQIREYPSPTLEEGAVLLRTLYSEVCGTDVHLFHGRLAGVPYPLIPGHVNVGQVERIAGTVTDVEGAPIREGQTVTFLDVHETCGHCWYCTVAKARTRCPHRKVYGITYSADEGLLGGWSEKIYLKPGVKILPLPDTVPPERFIGAGCGLPTAMHAVERADIALGDTVVVQGSGPIGLSVAVLAQLSGATQVIVIGGPPTRLAQAERMGADETIDILTTDVAQRLDRVLALTHGRGADVTIEATGVPGAVSEGFALTRDAGRYVIVGQYTDAGDIEMNPHRDINRKHLEVRGCWGSDFSHFWRGLRVMAKHGNRYRWEDLISRRYPLEQAGRALADVEAQRTVKAVIVPNA